MYVLRIIREFLKYFLLLVILLILTSSLWLKIISQKYLSPFLGKSKIIDKWVCNFSTKVSGESMSPVVLPGTSVTLTRCFTERDLTLNTVVLYYDDSIPRLGIIRHILPLDPVVYKISAEKSPELLQDVIGQEIIGISHNIDVSQSKYQSQEDIQSFILAPNDFLADLYLAKIPKGTGLEKATVEKTNTFTREQDKFCSAILLRKNLTAVDIEIINEDTKDTILLANNIVFNISEKPNINCQDFGPDQGMLNLDKGKYTFRFLMNHQVLENISFTVN